MRPLNLNLLCLLLLAISLWSGASHVFTEGNSLQKQSYAEVTTAKSSYPGPITTDLVILGYINQTIYWLSIAVVSLDASEYIQPEWPENAQYQRYQVITHYQQYLSTLA